MSYKPKYEFTGKRVSFENHLDTRFSPKKENNLKNEDENELNTFVKTYSLLSSECRITLSFPINRKSQIASLLYYFLYTKERGSKIGFLGLSEKGGIGGMHATAFYLHAQKDYSILIYFEPNYGTFRFYLPQPIIEEVIQDLKKRIENDPLEDDLVFINHYIIKYSNSAPGLIKLLNFIYTVTLFYPISPGESCLFSWIEEKDFKYYIYVNNLLKEASFLKKKTL
jgi:hypothetical protein